MKEGQVLRIKQKYFIEFCLLVHDFLRETCILGHYLYLLYLIIG